MASQELCSRINVHSHPRILETLKPYQATTWSGQDLRALTIDLEHLGPHSTKTTTNSPAYFMYPVNKVFMECLDKIVVIIIGDLLVHPKTEEDPFS